MDQTWWVARVVVNKTDYEKTVGWLAQTETLGFTEDYSANSVILHVYLPQDTDPHIFSTSLSEWVEYLSCNLDKIGRENWAENWKQHFTPFAIAHGMIVKPSWENYQPKPGETVIELDPGMAFGTGTHETTRLCAQALTESLPCYTDPSIFDLGCGSGILAIIAAMRGATTVVACDNDPVSIDVAKENAIRNGITSIPFYDNLDKVTGKYDIILANILLNTLIELKKSILERLNDGGRLIASGITTDQIDRLVHAYSPLKVIHTATQGDWAVVTFAN